MSSEAAVAPSTVSQQGVVPALLSSARPKQWTKNLILFGPLVFAYDLFQGHLAILAAGAFVAFCLVSSAIYAVNDLADVENDRQHPVKRYRALAAGRVTSSQMAAWACLLAAAGLAVAFVVDPAVGLAAAAYLVLMLAYSLKVKHLVILDAFAIAAGFILRAVAGALAIHVVISPWLYVCTLLLALFLGFSKRYNELLVLQDGAGDHRPILDEYTPEMLQQLMSIIVASTIMAYSLYTFSADSLPANHSMMLTIPFVMYGVFRYQYLVHRKNLGGAPEQVLLRDVPLMIDILLWGLTAVLVLYLGLNR